jgi:hypothetical protein
LLIDSILLGNAAASASQPAGLLNGLSTLTPSTGGGLGALAGDLKLLMAAIAPAVRPALIMNAGQAVSFSVLAEAPTVPVVTAPYLAPATVVAIDSAQFASALGVPDISTDENPTIHMESSAPLPIATGAQGSGVVASPTQSLWQTASVGIRTLIDCDWALRRTGAVAFITGTTW